MKKYFYDMIPINYSISEEQKESLIQKYPPPELKTASATFILDEAEKGTAVSTLVLVNDFEVKLIKSF